MTPENWQEVKKVLAAALERPPEERSVYLDQACTEPALRREVESLIDARDQGVSSFLEHATLTGEPLQNGSKLGQYTILARVGAGGMGEVYRARDTRLNRDVAIKVLPSFFSDDPDRLRRFEQEARAAAALNHPNILAVFQMGTYEGAPYLVSELLEGCTLREQLKRGPMPLRKVIDYGVQIARGLAAAHERGIVHRDLKPENLFVTKDGQVKILDFGLAKLMQRQWALEINAPTASDSTEPGRVIGTVGYMSPEQVSGKSADYRADIFAFGAVLYELLRGKRAFQKPTSAETMTAILNEDPPDVSQLAPTVPAALQRVLQRCLEKNPEQRFQSASDLAFALEALSDSSSASMVVIIRNKARFAAAVSIVILLLVAMFFLARMKKLPEAARIQPSIAVLPFADLSPEKDQEYFSDGLAEELLNRLAENQGLRVIARTSSFQFKGKNEDPRVIGQKLNVNTLLEGSVRKQGKRLRISVQLIRTSDGLDLWSETYDRDLTDVFVVQEDIARSVADSLKVTLLRGKGPSPRTTSVEAYNAYLQGQYFASHLHREDLEQAIAYYEEALKLDPSYALAWEGLSWAHFHYADLYGPKEGKSRAREEAERALTLYPNLADAYAVLGGIQASYDWNWVGAEASYQRALALEPWNVRVIGGAASIAATLNHFDEALQLDRRMVELDPLRTSAFHDLAYHAWWAVGWTKPKRRSRKD